ncbi:MAG: hypothetical protein IT371_22190 [Deltaproteobacteria bacterium]|nr:hypothetical protein [Deltaproteobacteria bacterium]
MRPPPVVTRPFREEVLACPEPQTFKYYLPPEATELAWKRLAAAYGPPTRQAELPLVTLESSALLLRATLSGNPITVIRKRGCAPQDLAAFHALIGYEDDATP